MWIRKYSLMDEAGNEDKGGTGGNDDALKALQTQLDTLKASNETITADNERLTAKVTEANKHTKAAEKAAQEEARKTAEADGNFEQLFKSSEQARTTLQSDFDTLKTGISTEKVKTIALKLAGTLAEGVNVEILSDYIAKRLTFTDDGIKVTDEKGGLTVSTLDDLKAEFAGSARFGSLIKGNQSSGGGASGGANGNSVTGKTISRAEFDAMDAPTRMKHCKDGGKVTDQK